MITIQCQTWLVCLLASILMVYTVVGSISTTATPSSADAPTKKVVPDFDDSDFGAADGQNSRRISDLFGNPFTEEQYINNMVLTMFNLAMTTNSTFRNESTIYETSSRINPDSFMNMTDLIEVANLFRNTSDFMRQINDEQLAGLFYFIKNHIESLQSMNDSQLVKFGRELSNMCPVHLNSTFRDEMVEVIKLLRVKQDFWSSIIYILNRTDFVNGEFVLRPDVSDHEMDGILFDLSGDFPDKLLIRFKRHARRHQSEGEYENDTNDENRNQLEFK